MYHQKQKFNDVERPIDMLPPGQVTYLSGTLKFTDLDLPPYEKAHLRFELDLGFIDNPSEIHQNIQIRNFSLQLAESYEYRPNSNFLLVVNCNNTKEEIDRWKNFA